MDGPWNAVVPWLIADAPIAALVTTGGGAPRIYRRRAPQVSIKPYIIVTGGVGWDNGNHTMGAMALKIARFRIIIASDTTASVLTPIAELIRKKLEVVINQQVGDWWIASFRILGADESESDAPDADESGLVTEDIGIRVGFSYKPVTP